MNINVFEINNILFHVGISHHLSTEKSDSQAALVRRQPKKELVKNWTKVNPIFPVQNADSPPFSLVEPENIFNFPSYVLVTGHCDLFRPRISMRIYIKG